MSAESAFIDSLRALATDPAARGLLDDAAVLEMDGAFLVLTHDMIVEGVHYLPGDPPADVAWKLVAVNLSDLAAKGAGARRAARLHAGERRDRAFAEGLARRSSVFAFPARGDTVSAPAVARHDRDRPAAHRAPSRAGARPATCSGFRARSATPAPAARAQGEVGPSDALVERYRNLRPRLEAGERLAPLVSAMMDVSDGLLLDAGRMAAASGCAVQVELDSVPLSAPYLALLGEARLDAAGAGDDYELLFAADGGKAGAILALAEEIGLPFSRIGRFAAGSGLALPSAERRSLCPRGSGLIMVETCAYPL